VERITEVKFPSILVQVDVVEFKISQEAISIQAKTEG
jgi:hypothetical protein